jgi:hypothetical protein
MRNRTAETDNTQETVRPNWEQIPLFQFCRPEDRNDIRLLHILPGNPGDLLQCKCIRYPSSRGLPGSQKPEYTAISYTWGGLNRKEPILLNNKKHYTTKNAKNVLLRIRSRQTSQIVWIDAICIYSYRTVTKHLGNLRFMPQFSEWFDFVSERKNLCSVLSRKLTYAPNGSLPFSFRKGSEAALISHVREHRGRPAEHGRVSRRARQSTGRRRGSTPNTGGELQGALP